MAKKSSMRQEDNSLGYWLWAVRTQQGYTLEDVAAHIRIRAEYLRNIESNLFDALPEGMYRLGYIQNYAKFLGLDPQAATDRYHLEQAPPAPEPQFYQPEAGQENKPLQRLLIIAALLGFAAVYGFWYVKHHGTMMPAPVDTSVPESVQPLIKKQDLDSSNILLPREEESPSLIPAPAPEGTPASATPTPATVVPTVKSAPGEASKIMDPALQSAPAPVIEE
jgi:cytoskeleton protein RodZ